MSQRRWKLVTVDGLYRVVWNVPKYAKVLKRFETKYDALGYFYDELA